MSWIKFDHCTPDKPEVFMMSEILGIDPDAVTGKLVRIWIWADQQTIVGDAVCVTRASLDRLAGVTGFASALIKVGWLIDSNEGFIFSNFDRHNGSTAKTRGLTAKRNSALRNRDAVRDASVTRSASPREEKRREEKSIKETPTPLAESSAVADQADDEISGSALEFVRNSWNAAGPIKCIRLTDKLRKAARARLKVPWWSEHWMLALERLSECRFLWGESDRGWKADLEWFLKPDSVQKILEGKYDIASNQQQPLTREQSSFKRSLDVLAKFAASDQGGSGESAGAPLRLEANSGI